MTDLHDLNERQREQVGLRMERFWECYVEGTDGGRHYKWWTLAEAESEAERLARLPDVQGRTVYLFECRGKCRIEQTPVKWEIPR